MILAIFRVLCSGISLTDRSIGGKEEAIGVGAGGVREAATDDTGV